MKYDFSFRHRYFPHRHTWEDAEKDCREHSAHLGSILSAPEQEFINGTCVFVFVCSSEGCRIEANSCC